MKDKCSLLRFLKEIDNDFSPSLSEKVVLSDYVDKILKKACLVIESYKDDICGLIVLYCNDFINKKAYISLVGVAPKYRNRGIAKMMIEKAIHIAANKEMEIIGIHSNNSIAIHMYEKFGFKIIEPGERVYMELKLR